AAYQIFSWKSGAFQFRPERPSGTATIQNSTESVMLEAARRMDEASLTQGGLEGPSVTERLSERQESLEALRDVFRQVTTDAGEAGAPAPAEESAPPGTSHTLGLADGRIIGLEVVSDGPDEALWLRPVAIPAPDASRLRGSLDRLEQVINLANGLILVG